MYRIRFHGRGGQGMKTASRILGSAFFRSGWEVQDAPRYGAERRGAPLAAYVRAARGPIHERGVIPNPDLALVADDGLPGLPAAGVLAGLDARSTLVVVSREDAGTWRERLALAGPLVVLDPPSSAHERTAIPRAGVMLAGAAARLVRGIERAALEEAVADELGGLGAEAVATSARDALATYDALAERAGSVAEGVPPDATAHAAPQWVELPLDAIDVATPAVHGAATSVEVRTGLWRVLRPVIDESLCRGCWWVCSTFCPDNAIAVDAGGRPQIDLDHCKGCGICVAQCPTHAIEAVPEGEALAS